MSSSTTSKVRVPALLLEGATERDVRVMAQLAERLIAEDARRAAFDGAGGRYARPSHGSFLRKRSDRRTGRAAGRNKVAYS